jgi:hypothetical protein
MFEVVRDWNYATAGNCAESAFNFYTRAARDTESAFFFASEKIFS